MHPTLSFDLIQQDHRDRIETTRQVTEQATRRTDQATRSDQNRGRPERPSRPRLRALLTASSAVATIR